MFFFFDEYAWSLILLLSGILVSKIFFKSLLLAVPGLIWIKQKILILDGNHFIYKDSNAVIR